MTQAQIDKKRKLLKKYEKSDAWKNLQEYCRNREENISNKIKNKEYLYEVQYSTDDIELEKANLLREFAEKSGDEFGEFKQFLTEFAEAKEWNVMMSHITNFGYSPSEKKFTDKDLDVVRMWECRVIHQEQNRLTALIGQMDKQEKKQMEDVYES